MVRRSLPKNKNVDDFLYKCARRFMSCDDWHIKWVRINGSFEVYADTRLNLPAKNLDFLPAFSEVLLEVNTDHYSGKGQTDFSELSYHDFKKIHLEQYEAMLARGQWSRNQSQKFWFNVEHRLLAVNFNDRAVCFYVEEGLMKTLSNILNTETARDLPQNVSYFRHNV